MKAKEKAIRDAAEALRTAIVEGEASGLSVGWPPRRVGDLASMEISETGAIAVNIAVATPDIDIKVTPAEGGGIDVFVDRTDKPAVRRSR